jgi:alpha-glucosidase
MLRPTFLDHEHDENTFAECDDFMLGQNLLVASVVEPGQRERDVYLPANECGWYDFYTGQWFSGNQTITLPAPLERLPLLVKAGSVLPTSDRIAYSNSQEDTTRNLEIFPLQGTGNTSVSVFDDDGETNAYLKGQFLEVTVDMACDHNAITLSVTKTGDYQPAYTGYKLVLPEGEHRQLIINEKVYQNGDVLPLSSLLKG